MPTDLAQLLHQCAPGIGAVTMQAIIRTESAGYAYAVADGGPASLPWRQRSAMVRSLNPKSAAAAERDVQRLLARGHVVAIGPAQINVANLPALGLSVRQALQPCTNIAAGAKILRGFYTMALRRDGPGNTQRALLDAISAYGSGDFQRGFSIGYVQHVVDNAGQRVVLTVPDLRGQAVLSARHGSMRIRGDGQVTPYNAPLEAPGFVKTERTP